MINKTKVTRKANLHYKDLKVSQGNKKLYSNEYFTFLLWNITSKVTCPYATESCKKSCYAFKSERMYKNTLERNESNLQATQKDSFINNMREFIQMQLEKKSNKNKTIIFRIHESGDFYSKQYVYKWIQIANYFRNDNIVFQAYTKSIEFLKGLNLDNVNIKFTYSIWNDTKERDINLAKNMKLQTYEAFPKKELQQKVDSENYFECECVSCVDCLECYRKDFQKIAVAIH